MEKNRDNRIRILYYLSQMGQIIQNLSFISDRFFCSAAYVLADAGNPKRQKGPFCLYTAWILTSGRTAAQRKAGLQ